MFNSSESPCIMQNLRSLALVYIPTAYTNNVKCALTTTPKVPPANNAGH